MTFESFDPIFSEPKAVWAAQNLPSPRRFLLHVYASDSSHLVIHVTDFHSNTWEANRSVLQLEDMRDTVGIGDSWSEFIDYVAASIQSEELKLVLEGIPNSDDAAARAKLVAQKSKGMPLITISLSKLVGSAAGDAMANLSLGLFRGYQKIKHSLTEDLPVVDWKLENNIRKKRLLNYSIDFEEDRCLQLTKVVATEKEKYEAIQKINKQKLRKVDDLEKADASKSSPDKLGAQNGGGGKVTKRAVPAYRRARVRGAVLQDNEDDEDN